MTATTAKHTCPICNTPFHCERDEDGRPELPGQACADPTCPAWLCPVCIEQFAFHCDACGKRFCSSHKTEMPDGTDRPLKLCAICYVEAALAELEEREPECTCRQTDADLFDARGCELHDVMSEWNCRLRSLTMVQQYERATGDAA